MSDFIGYKETQNIKPFLVNEKEQYYWDIQNIQFTWTGRADAQIANTFFEESVQLLINAVTLFEKGYFDCAFYSLRQSLEVSTTIIYLIDTNNEGHEEDLKKWKNQSKFPMYAQMLNLLTERGNVFSDIKSKMSEYFKEIEETKNKLNKYVHKQGFGNFYIVRNHSFSGYKDDKSISNDFEKYLIKCIGAIAVFRLAVDPYPILLREEEIYKRTDDMMTQAYSEDFVRKYIGEPHITNYKTTDFYKSHYDSIIKEEPKLPSVVDVVKHQYVDKKKIEEMLTQKHLLNRYELAAVFLLGIIESAAKVYAVGGFFTYSSTTSTVRIKLSWSSDDFKNITLESNTYNNTYDEAFLSYIRLFSEDFYLEHNERLGDEEIEFLNQLTSIHKELNDRASK